MSSSSVRKVYSIGGFLEYFPRDGYIFTDTRSNDIGLYSDYKDQQLIFGTQSNAPSAFRITSNEVQFNYNIYVGQSASIGTSNVRNYMTPHRLVLEGPSNSVMGPHIAAYVIGDSNYPLYQQYNNKHDDIYLSFDSYKNGSIWYSSHSNNNYQIAKNSGTLNFNYSSGSVAGAPITWSNALSITKNGFIGFNNSPATHRFTLIGPDSSMSGPHVAYYTDADRSNPVFEQRNWTHNDISQVYDAYWSIDSNNWISSTASGNFMVTKSNSRFNIMTGCNVSVGDVVTWQTAMSISSNSLIGFGTSNTTHRLTIMGTDSSSNGPHMAYYTDTDITYPVFEQRNWTHDDISQVYDGFWNSDSNYWMSSSVSGNFMVTKVNGRYSIMTSCNVDAGNQINWQTAMTISSNSLIGFGTDNVTHRLTVMGTDSSSNGPHIAYYTDADGLYPVFQQRNWKHNDISQVYDGAWNADTNNWISSTDSGNFMINKQNSSFNIMTAFNVLAGDQINWNTAMSVNSNNFITIGGKNPTHQLTIISERPHIAYYINTDETYPIFQQYNRSHNNISQVYDAHWNNDSNYWMSSTDTGNFMLTKQNSRFSIMIGNNIPAGDQINWQTAMTVSSNSLIGFGTDKITHRLTVMGNDSSTRGPHIAYYTDADSIYPVFEQRNWTHNDISQVYDGFWNSDSNYWMSSSVSGNFMVTKQNSKFSIMTGCNVSAGDQINWQTAMTVSSNSFIGFGTNNTTHRLTVMGTDSSSNGPHMAYYTDTDSVYPVFQQRNWTHNDISQVYDGFWNAESNYWMSSTTSGNFMVNKQNGSFNIMTGCNVSVGDAIAWRTAMSINSNNFISIGGSNPTHQLTIAGKDPHIACYTETDSVYPVFEQYNAAHDDISQIYDAHWSSHSNYWMSSTASGNFMVSKQNSSLNIMTGCNVSVGDAITWQTAMVVSSNSLIGFGTSNTTHRLTVMGDDSSSNGPHIAYYTDLDNIYPVFEQRNWTHNDISQVYDGFWNAASNYWMSSSVSGNFMVTKQNSSFNIMTGCNVSVGDAITWQTSMMVSSNSMIGLGTNSNMDVTHRLTLMGPSNSMFGPNIGCYFIDQSNPSFQIYNSDFDNISVNFDSYWNGYHYISSSDKGNFQIIKTNSQLRFQSIDYAAISDNIDNAWTMAMVINSNSYIGIGTSNPEAMLDLVGESVFRSNISLLGNIIPRSNNLYNLGGLQNRFHNAWVGGAIDINNMKIATIDDGNANAIAILDASTGNEPGRLIANELIVGNAADGLNSNVYRIYASSNGLQMKSYVAGSSNLSPYIRFNNMFLTDTSVGIGLSNPETSLQIVGDMKINPSEYNAFVWDYTVIRMNNYNNLNNINQSVLYNWGDFTACNAPIIYNTSENYIQCSHNDSYFTSQSNYVISSTSNGFTATIMARFNKTPQSNEIMFSFSNSTNILQLGRYGVTSELQLILNGDTFTTNNKHAIMQNRWTLFTIQTASNIVNIYKDNINIYTNSLTDADAYMSFNQNTILGNANIDLSSFYVFDKIIVGEDLDYLNKKIMYSGNKNFQIKTNGNQYPPMEFYDDTVGWNTVGKRNGGQVYEKCIENTYYGTGVYKVWTNNENIEWDSPVTFAFNNNEIGWTTVGNNIYNKVHDAEIPATLYMELPVFIQMYSYTISPIDGQNDQAPYKWTFYGSMNGVTWITLDQQDGQIFTALNQFLIKSIDSCKFFKLEVYKNNSAAPDFISIGKFALYGDANTFVVDGTNIGINTSVPKDALSVEGTAYISSKLTIGAYDDSLKLNIFESPTSVLAGYINNIDNKIYIVSDSSYAETGNEGYRLFSKTYTDKWVGAGIYNNLGNYQGEYSTIIDGVERLGEWVQIQLPSAIKLDHFKLAPSTNLVTAPIEFYIAGSDDGSNWTAVYYIYNYEWTNSSESVFYTKNIDIAYSYYRLVIIRVKNTLSTKSVELVNISLYGSVYTNPVGDSSELLVRGDLHVNRNIIIANERTEPLFKCDANDLSTYYKSGSEFTEWGKFSTKPSSIKKPVFYSEPFPNVYMQGDSMMDAGLTHIPTTGFTLIIKAKILTGSYPLLFVLRHYNGQPILFQCDSSDNKLYFRFDTYSISMDIIFEEWHVYSVRYQPNLVELYRDEKLMAYDTNISSYHLSTIFYHSVIGQQIYTDYPFYISSLLTWSSTLADDEFIKEISQLKSNAKLFVQGNVKFTEGYQGNLEIKSDAGFSSTTFIYPPAPIISPIYGIKNTNYGNGTYEVSASLNNENAFVLFDNNPNTYWFGVVATPSITLTHIVDGTFVYGDWVQMKLPCPIILVYYEFLAENSLNAPTAWTLVGSDDGLRWFNIGNNPETYNSWTTDPVITYLPSNINNNKSYHYYRWIFVNSPTIIQLKSIKLYAKTATAFSTNDTNVVVFDRLGINITEPAAALHVAGFSILSGLKIIATNASNVNVPPYPIGGEWSGGGGGGLSNIKGYINETTGTALSIVGNNANYKFRFLTNDTSNEVMRINGLGNVGIGTSNPIERLEVAGGNALFGQNVIVRHNLGIGLSNFSPLAPLHVSGDALFDCNITFCNKLIGGTSNYEDWGAVLQNNGVMTSISMGAGQGIKINTGSRFNLPTGTTAYSNYYNVAALECLNSDYGSLLYVANNGKIGMGTSNVLSSTSSTLSIMGSLSLLNSNGEAIIYTNNCNIGIGKSNPSAKLDVAGDINYTGNIYQNGDLVPFSRWLASSNNSNLLYYMDKVGILTSNLDESFSIVGDMSLSNYGKIILSTSNSGLGINMSNLMDITESVSIGGGSMSFSNYGKTLIYASNTNMGVGVTNPAFKLDVGGDINISGQFYQGGSPYVSSQWVTANNNIYYPNTGYVGIGTCNPGSALHVIGDISVHGHVLPDSNGVYTMGSVGQSFGNIYTNVISLSNTIIKHTVSDNSITFTNSNTSVLKKIIIGELQIGNIGGEAIDSNVFIFRSSNESLSVLNSANVPVSCISGIYVKDSNIGIGLANPQYPLDVVGNLNVSGQLYQNGNPYETSRWNSNMTGIYVMSNIGVGGLNVEGYALNVNGNIGISNLTGSVGLFTSGTSLGINTSNITDTLTLNGPSISLFGGGGSNYIKLYANQSNLGINKTNAAFALDISGDINFDGNIYQNGSTFQNSRWSCNFNGIYVESNVGIGIAASSNYTLTVDGPMIVNGPININNGVTFYTNTSNLGINKLNAGHTIDINGDLNYDGSMYKNGQLTQQWYSSNNSIYVGCNVGIGIIPVMNSLNKLHVVGNSFVDGNLNITGNMYINSNLVSQNPWLSDSNSNGIFITSNIGIGIEPTTDAALTINGNIAMNTGLLLKGIQISKSAVSGAMTNITQQVYNIPGASNNNSNVVFYKGLYMSGLRLSSGNPAAPLNVLYASSNITGYQTFNSNIIFSIPTYNAMNYFKFVAGNTSNTILTMTGDGKFGFNTNSPADMFHINSTTLITGQSFTISNSASPYLKLQNTLSTNWQGVASVDNTFSTDAKAGDYVMNHLGGKIILQCSNVGLRSAICINSNNNVGIQNSNPLYPLDVNGIVKCESLMINSSILTGSNGYFGFSNNTTPQFTIDLSGAPSTALNTTNNTNPTVGSTSRMAIYSGEELVLQSGGKAILLDSANSSLRPWTANQFDLGTSGLQWKTIYAVNGTVQTSDSLTKDYTSLSYGLSNLLQIQTIKYKWKTQANLPNDDPNKNHEYYGVLADQVDRLFPELVYNQQRPYQLNYSEFIPIIINAIKDLNSKSEGIGKEYIELTYPIDNGVVFDDFTIAGINRNGNLTNKYSEATMFNIISQNNRVASTGRIRLNKNVLNGAAMPNAGDYIIPALGPMDSIAAYSVSDFRVSFNEYKSAIGKVLNIDSSDQNYIFVSIKVG